MEIIKIKHYWNTVLTFYNPEKANYWNSITRCNFSQKKISLHKYYLDFSSKINYPNTINSDGIPILSHQDNMEIEHPLIIAQYGLGIFSLLEKRKFQDTLLLNKFIKVSDWFVDNKKQYKNGCCWTIELAYPNLGLIAPWVSAMVLGQAISILSRASLLTENKIYESTAVEALVPFDHSVSEGGVKNYFRSFTIYEEFPTKDKPSVVLNGFIFALFGLFDLILLKKDEAAMRLFNAGIDSLISLLPFYDSKYWSLYYLYNYPKKYYSSQTYHIIAYEQLKALYYITNKVEFFNYSKKWEQNSVNNIYRTLALLNKLIISNELIK